MATAVSGPVLEIDRALSPSIVRAAKVCQEKGLTKYRWSCKQFPEIHGRYDNHLLAQSSRPGRERWLNPENAVGSKAWMAKTGKHQQGRKWLEQYQEFAGHLSDSWNLHPTLPVRDAWIQGSPQGCIDGNPTAMDPPMLGHQPKGYATWIQGGGERWTPDMQKVPRVVGPREFYHTSRAGLTAISQGKDEAGAKEARKGAKVKLDRKLDRTNPRRASESGTPTKNLTATLNSALGSTGGSGTMMSRQTSGSGSQTQSLPTLALGPYPPSPAYVRNFMKHIDLQKPDM